MYKGLYVYPWDLADEGLDTVIGRARACGLNTLTCASSYHAGKFLRPHGRAGKVYFPQDGTVYFRPRPDRYGRIQPLVNPLVEGFDVFDAIRQAAPDLERVGWTVCLHNTPLGERNPDYVTRNAFGDPYWYSLCPAHPEVRAYVVNLCVDLVSRYELSGLVLETPGWLPYDHGFHHEFAMVPLDRWSKALLALCFADATRKAARAADIDADRLQAQARAMLERFFASDVAVPDAMAREWLLADVIGDPEWAAFLHWRCRVVADLIAQVRAALPPVTRLAVIPTVQRPTAGAWLEGSDIAMLAGAADALEIPAYHASAEEVAADAFDVRRRAGDQASLHFILRPGHPDLAGGKDTVAAVSALRAVNPAGVAFYNYGHLRLAGLERIEAALAALEAA